MQQINIANLATYPLGLNPWSDASPGSWSGREAIETSRVEGIPTTKPNVAPTHDARLSRMQLLTLIRDGFI